MISINQHNVSGKFNEPKFISVLAWSTRFYPEPMKQQFSDDAHAYLRSHPERETFVFDRLNGVAYVNGMYDPPNVKPKQKRDNILHPTFQKLFHDMWGI